MRLSTLIRDVGIVEVHADESMHVMSISSDSRTVLRGGMFICIRGEHRDGHDYISDAVDRGAAVIVVSDTGAVPHGVPYVFVPDTRTAEAYIWNAWYEDPAKDMKVIAVTGTNGKTSVAFMLKSIFEHFGRKVGVITTVGAEACGCEIPLWGGSSISDACGAMTTPDPEYLYGAIYAMRNLDVEFLIFEASSHALSQHKTDPICPDVAVFTNLSPEHLDYHRNMEEYFASKCRLADMADTLIINADDDCIARIQTYEQKGHRVISCSARSEGDLSLSADVNALRREESIDGTNYIFFSDEAVFRMTSPIPGSFTVYNTMLAAAAAMTLGVPASAVRDGIAKLSGVCGRMEAIDVGDESFSVLVDYAHTPDAVRSLLMSVRSLTAGEGRILLLFGCGGDRDRTKRGAMGEIASQLADFSVITSDNSRSEDPSEIIDEIMRGFDPKSPHAVIPDRKEAIEYIISIAREHDTVLLVGKGHEKYEITADGKHPFDESEIVKNAVLRRARGE